MNDTKFTRREVLKTGCVLAAGIAAPTVITSTALGGAAKAAASERITVGHIGVGGRGRDLFGGVRGLADAQSVAVADCYEDRRTAMAAVCGGKAYKDFREMLERDDIDAVVIATADHQHVPIANMAARKKKSAY
ncbi:MAG: gfo/Idh/MocA family oxidoreductase, partial [Planctomycetes bacterium]|nr:gfo/Idh/MocA family oxidoreductase [Planctomycetota bacterium]